MERFANRGGNYNNGSTAGPAYCNFNNRRSNTNAFRPVFVASQMPGVYGHQDGAYNKKSFAPSSYEENTLCLGRPVGDQYLRPPYRAFFSTTMKTHNNLWLSIIDFENLYLAYREAARCKRYRKEVLKFTENLEENLITLHNELAWGYYEPSAPKEFYVTIPKKRLISAPAFRDRVVHHALCSVIEPLIDARFIHDTYACRKGKGNHRAVARVRSLCASAQRQWGDYYAYKGDIKGFFPSIPHDRLKSSIRRIIFDPCVLDLIDLIIDSHPGARGLPIGALTSQLLANLYLSSLDHFAKTELRISHYVRYMDDFVLLACNSRAARESGECLTEYVVSELDMQMNSKSSVVKGSSGLPFCGFRVWPDRIMPAKPAFRRGVRRLRHMRDLYRSGKIGSHKAAASVASFIAHYKHCAASRSVRSVLSKLILERKSA